MTGRTRTSPGHSAARLLIAAGLLTVVNNYLPGSGHLDLAVLNGIAGAAVLLGVVSLLVPWDRLSPRAPLVLVLAAFGLIAGANLYGGVSDFSYAVYFVVVFVWVGIAQPPGTSLLLSPLAVAAYLLPFFVRDDAPANAVPSVTVAIPVCVLVGETLARSVRRLEQSRSQLRDQVDEVVRQRAREQAVVDALADGVLVLDQAGMVTAANRAAARMLRRDVHELVGAVPPIPIGAPGTPTEHEAGGRHLEAVSAALPTPGELVVALRDVSRQRALDEAKDLFLATTSHELRTPLTAIKGYVRTLQKRWDVLPESTRREALATISERTDALVQLTDHLLLGARAGVSRHSTPAQPFDLLPELARAVDQYRSLSARHPVGLDAPDDLPPVLGDPATVGHVVGQLVENAVKYSPQGGPVCVTARSDEGFVSVEVSDRGIGIPPGSEADLFTPFFQAGDTDTREYGGVGLGLYIVRQLVEAQGGQVSAHNRPEGGAVFRVTLPRAAVPAA